MREYIIKASLVGSALIIAQTFGVFEGIILFVLMGMVPASDVILSPAQMAAIFSIVTALVVTYVAGGHIRAFLYRTYTLIRARLLKGRAQQT